MPSTPHPRVALDSMEGEQQDKPRAQTDQVSSHQPGARERIIDQPRRKEVLKRSPGGSFSQAGGPVYWLRAGALVTDRPGSSLSLALRWLRYYEHLASPSESEKQELAPAGREERDTRAHTRDPEPRKEGRWG